jgi:GT2 family glycosyltransferase
LISIVVLTYNQLEECTKPCIESIYKYSADEEFELIVVDNNSQDNTAEYLRSIVTSYPNMTIICNDTNKGYAGGNNDGIEVAKGDYVILLNNDTLVSEGWLGKIIKPFTQDRKVGLVGPISNSVGNEQRVNIEGLSEKNYNEKSQSYTKANEGVIFQTQRLGFFLCGNQKRGH